MINNMKTIQELDNIAIEMINFMKEKDISIFDMEYILDKIPKIVKIENKIQKIKI